MFMPRVCLRLPPADRAQLTDVAANGNTAQKLAVRARILLLLADRVRPSRIATDLALSRNHVHYWQRRYLAQGVSGVLHDAPRPGRRKRITPEHVAAIVTATLHTKPPAATQWSTRMMARAQHVSEKTIRNIWHQHGLQPHRVTRFKLSKDRTSSTSSGMSWACTQSAREGRRVLRRRKKWDSSVGPDAAGPAAAPPIPERQTHDYIRHGTTCLCGIAAAGWDRVRHVPAQARQQGIRAVPGRH
jgi:transposase